MLTSCAPKAQFFKALLSKTGLLGETLSHTISCVHSSSAVFAFSGIFLENTGPCVPLLEN